MQDTYISVFHAAGFQQPIENHGKRKLSKSLNFRVWWLPGGGGGVGGWGVGGGGGGGGVLPLY